MTQRERTSEPNRAARPSRESDKQSGGELAGDPSQANQPTQPDEAIQPGETTQRLEPTQVAALFVEHADELRAFLLGVLRQRDLVADALQRAFVKAIEFGHAARPESLKSWLFQVAYREALVLRRREATDSRAMEQVAARDRVAASDAERAAAPDVVLARRETIVAVRSALEQLPPEQRRVVRMRMYDEMKFSDIAQQLEVPLGTVLTRMQLALKKLRTALGAE